MILDWKNDCFIWMWFHSSYPILMNWDIIPLPHHLQYWYQMNSCIEEWYFCCLESNVSGLCDCWWMILNNTWWNEVMSYQIMNWVETNVNHSDCWWDLWSVYERNDERAFECCDKDDCVECVKMNGDNDIMNVSPDMCCSRVYRDRNEDMMILVLIWYLIIVCLMKSLVVDMLLIGVINRNRVLIRV